MKKLVVFVTVCFFTVVGANAQVTFKPGVRGGLNIASLTNSDSDAKVDFYVGGLMAIKFFKFYTLQPELTYSRQGAVVKNYDYSNYPAVAVSKTRYSLDYLSLGIMNKFTFGKGFFVAVGPSLDFQVADNFVGVAANDLQGFDFSLVGGVGYSLPNGLAFEARIKQGFVDIFGNNYGYYDDNYYYENNNGNHYGNYNNGYNYGYNYRGIDEVVLNQVVQLGVSYTFDLKK